MLTFSYIIGWQSVRRHIPHHFYDNPASLPHEKLMQATKLIGTRIAPALREVGEQEVKVL
jgi:hypothetical protein